MDIVFILSVNIANLKERFGDLAKLGPHAAPSGEARRRECAVAGGLYLWRRPLVKEGGKADEYWMEPR